MEYNSCINKRIARFLHKVLLIVMLHSSFIAPSQSMLSDYFNYKTQRNHSQVSRKKDNNNSDKSENVDIQQRDKNKTLLIKEEKKKKEPHNSYNHFEAFDADIDHGTIGVTTDRPLDDPSDNIFKFQLPTIVNNSFKAFLSYEIYGVDESATIPWSINERYTSGGGLIKQNKKWNYKKEEINSEWLLTGNNTLMFSVPKGAMYSYEVRDVKILFEKIPTGSVISPIVVNTPVLSFFKNDQIYIKGFIRNAGNNLKVYADEIDLNVMDGTFEGFVSLNKKITEKGFIIIKAIDNNGLVGQELVYIENLSLADQIYTTEIPTTKTTALLESSSTGTISTTGAKLIFSEDTFDLPVELSISKLRSIDIAPLSSGMINVTKGGFAYRLLPSGTKFKNEATIEIEYDETLLPAGYSVDDIKTFRFDKLSKSWLAVEKVAVNSDEKSILSLVEQSSDYINGIIQSPESPETAGFTPTMMNNIQAADPSAEMTLISPPEVNQKGTANISYPIKIPSGRNGMQPNLTVKYNSEASSGWMGLGWSINTPTITIDTRWGVPEFDMDYETVIYTLEGEQLMYPKIKNRENAFVDWMPNRHYDDAAGIISTEPRAKINAAIFTHRKQGSFETIERLGNSPANYYWKVTSSNGTISWYGGKKSAEDNYVLKQGNAAAGNIVYWALYMVEDIHGNNILYNYDKNTNFISTTENNTNLNGGTSFNLKKINYTGYNDNPGLYEVQFITNKDGNPVRKDPTINARLGLKQIDPYLLTNVIVKKTNSTDFIRSYQFNYKEGEFQKTLLESIKELDAKGNEFYQHTFDYHNEVRNDNNFVLFDKPYTVELPNLIHPAPAFTLGVGNILGYSKINTSQSIEAGWGSRISLGGEFKFRKHSQNPNTTITIGLPFGQSYPKEKGIITMADIDGNGLDDIIYKTTDGLKYFPHFLNEVTGKSEFGSQKSITGISNFSNNSGKSKTMFLESFDIRARVPFTKKEFYFGIKRFKSQSKTDIYFTDGNGDGLLDIVKDKMVFFNQEDIITGGRKFTTSSQQTPNMLITANVNEIADIEHPEPEVMEDSEGYDVVRVWIAPKNGTIKINDEIHLESTNNNSSSYYSIETAVQNINNGLPFRLYLKKLTNQSPGASVIVTNYSGNSPSLGSSKNSILEVTRGQKIFFRITKNPSEVNDKVNTNPVITYLDEPDANTLLDENLADHKVSSYEDGFILSADDTFETDRSGMLNISWNDIFVNQPSDMVEYQIVKEVSSPNYETQQVIYSSIVFEGTVGYVQQSVNQISGGHNFSTPMHIQISPGKDERVTIRFIVTSDSNLKWKDIQWKPKLRFTPDEATPQEGMATLETVKYPIAEYSIYKTNLLRKLIPVTGWNTPDTAVNYGIKPNTNVTLDPADNGNFIMVVKRNGALVGKRYVNITNGVVTLNDNTPISFGTPINIHNPSSQFQYSVGYYIMNSSDENIFNKYQLATNYKTALLGYNWSAALNSSAYLPVFVESKYNNLDYLGPLHREWGQFNYNDELDTNITTPSDALGKLINPNIGNRYEALENALSGNLVNPNSSCFSLSTNEEITSCLEQEYIDSLGLPDEITPDNIDSINLEHLLTPDIRELLMDPLMTSKAVRNYPNQIEVEKWIGLFDTQYTTETQMRSGSFSGSAFDNVFPDDTDEITIEQANLQNGMQAINKNRNSVSYSKTIGWGKINLSKANSRYSNAISDFIDINGDKYPDMMSSTHIQFTKMTGGHKPSIAHSFGNINNNSNKNIRLTQQGGSQDLGRGDVEKDGEKTDQGNPALYKGIGVDVNLTGENKELSFWSDINGDGLPDKIINQNGYKYQLNLGNAINTNIYSTFNRLNSLTNKPNVLGLSASIGVDINSLFDTPRLPIDLNLSAGISNSASTTTNTLLDINGDGLVDLLNINQGAGSVYINTGNGFTDTPLPISSYLTSLLVHENTSTALSVSGSASIFKGKAICCFFIPIVHVKGGITVSGDANLSISNAQRAFKDFNGDGYVDYIENQGSTLKVYPSRIGQTNLLKSVHNPIGGSFEMSYNVIPVNYDNPHPKWVMSQVTVKDGYDKVNDGLDDYTKTFSYEKGKYDRREREFYGYEIVKTFDNDQYGLYRTNVSKYYNNSYFLNGLLKEQYVMKGANENEKFSRTLYTYEIKKLNNTNSGIDLTSTVPLTFDVGGKEGRRSAAVLPVKTVTELYELNNSPQIISEINMKYDTKGRISEYKYLGNTATNADDFTTIIKYHNLTNNIINIPSEVYVLINGQEKRKRTTDVDPSTGKVIKIKSYLSGSTFAATTIKYDQYGNIIYMEGPKNVNNQSMYYSYTYDTQYNKYVVMIKDAYGYTSSAAYNSDFDKITSSKDMAGNITKYEYDPFGRTTLIRAPKEIDSGANYTLKFTYYPKLNDLPSGTGITAETFVPVALTQHFDVQHPKNDIETITFIDGLARPIQVKKDITLNSDASHKASNYYEAMSVSGKSFFDQFGRSVKQFHPYFEEKTFQNKFRLNEHQSPYVTTIVYDELDRITKVTDAGNNTSVTSYSIATDINNVLALKTRNTTDQNGIQSVVSDTYKDVRGLVISTMNEGPDGAIWTKFKYNGINELMSYTDHENITTMYKYDGLGRKIAVSHKDNGNTTYKYDLTGNLIQTQTANLAATGNYITYKYFINQLIEIVFPKNPDGSDNLSNVKYKYGNTGNQTGKLIWQKDATGTQDFSYGSMGELTKIQRTIVAPMPSMPVRTFATDFNYDSWNRLLFMVYPDGEKVTFSYDLGGNLNGMIGSLNGNPYPYIEKQDYDHYEQKVYHKYGNKTETYYTYSPELRLLNQLNLKASDGQILFNNAYKYDKVGNILSIKNDADATTNNMMGGKYEHIYKYDKLNRLTNAGGLFKGHEMQQTLNNDFSGNYDVSLKYNATHGIIEKFQSHQKNEAVFEPNTYENHYKYESGTHKVASITNNIDGATDTYKYDKNGNLQYKSNDKKGDIRTMYWDESNRLRVVNDNNTALQHYIYDAAGERILKASSDLVQTYENGTLVTPSTITINAYTTYPNAYLVIDEYGIYSKHYFAGTQRIVSRIGDKPSNYFNTTAFKSKADEDYSKIKQNQTNDLNNILAKANMDKALFKEYQDYTYTEIEKEIQQENVGRKPINPGVAIPFQPATIYFYHPDHLGTSTYLTDINGNAYQFFLNLPFGETMAEQLPSNYYTTPYKFSGKELDNETGLYYFGARYYDPKASIWLSVDPLVEQTKEPYLYAGNNPIRYIDPTGKSKDDWIKNLRTGEFIWDKNVTSESNTPEGFSYVGKDNQSITRNLFGGTSFTSKTSDIGTIDFQDFDNPYSAKGSAAMYINTKTNMNISLLANVTEKYDSSGNATSKVFNGIDISTVISGKVIAPYADMNMKLFEREMTMQGNPMNEYKPNNSEFVQGGDVTSLVYKSFWNAKSIQNNFGSSYNIDFKFKGQYANGLRSMTMPGILGTLGIPNATNGSAQIRFRNLINSSSKLTPIKP